MKTIKKYRNGQFIECSFKEPPEKIKKFVKETEKITNSKYDGSIDKYGREIPDPRPIVSSVKVLTKEQKIFNQFLIAHNRAALEKENLPWDFSTPEKSAQSMKEIFDLDMPEEKEFISQYEYKPMVEDWPKLPVTPPEPEPKTEPESSIPEPPTPEPTK